MALPDAITLGSAECLANGDLLSQGVPVAQMVGGFVPGCFMPRVPNLDMEFGFSVWSCPTQLFWCDVITQLGENHYTDVHDMCIAQFRGSTVSVFAATLLFPPFVVVKHPDYCCVASAGTGTLFQVLVQALSLIQGPQNYGDYSTGQLWYDYATYLITILSGVGVLDGRPILIAGHSYGGCSAVLLAARLRQALPKLEIRYITFGMPKPGDSRLSAIIDQQFDGLSLVNDGDLLTALPPEGSVIAAMSSYLPVRVFLPWTAWSYPPETTLMIGKDVDKNTYQRFDSLALAQYILHVFSTGKLLSVPAHTIQEYGLRIRARCTRFLPTDIGQVYGLIRADEQFAFNVGEVYGMTFAQGTIPTTCCPSGMAVVLPIQITAANPPQGYLVGTTWNLTYSSISSSWLGNVITAHGTIQAEFSCDGVAGWKLDFFGTYTMIAHVPSSCGTLTYNHLVTGPLGSSFCTIVVGTFAPPILVVQAIGSTTTGPAVSLASAVFGSNVTAGNTLVATFAIEDIAAGSGVPTSVTDSLGNTYTQDITAVNGTDRVFVYRSSNCLGGAGCQVTIHVTAASYITILGAIEVSGLDTVSPLDGGSSTNAAIGPTPANTGAFSTTHPTCLLIAAFADQAVHGGGYADPAGFTLIGSEFSGGVTEDGAADYQIVSVPQVGINPTWSLAVWGVGRWCAAGIAYKGV